MSAGYLKDSKLDKLLQHRNGMRMGDHAWVNGYWNVSLV